MSPQHRTPHPDTSQDTSNHQDKTTNEETHSKRRRNRKNRRHKDKPEQPQPDKNNEHVNGRQEKQTIQDTDPGLRRVIETVRQNADLGQRRVAETVTIRGPGKASDEPGGARVPQRSEWTNSGGVGDGGLRKKFKAVGEVSSVLRTNTRRQGSTNSGYSEECESRLVCVLTILFTSS